MKVPFYTIKFTKTSEEKMVFSTTYSKTGISIYLLGAQTGITPLKTVGQYI